MKPSANRRSIKVSVLLILCSVVVSAAVFAQAVELSYDAMTDRIRIRADNASVVELLSRIAATTGIKVEIDLQLVQERISVERDSVPLEQLLRELLRRYSYVLQYGDQPGMRQVVSLTLLPKGVPSGRSLVLNPDVDDGAPWERSGLEVSGATQNMPASIKILQSQPASTISVEQQSTAVPAQPRAALQESDPPQSPVMTDPQMAPPRSAANDAAAGSTTP